MYLIIFGGSSFEHEISIVSAINLKDKLLAKFIYLDENRDFYLIDRKDLKASYFTSKEYKNAQKVELTKGGFKYQKGLFKKDYYVKFDVAINLVHGRDGEDGKLPAMLQFFGIKAITPNVEASVISYNKVYTKAYLNAIGVDTIDYEIIKVPKTKFDFPVIVKPARLGSSIGVSIAKNQKELEYAFDVAKEFDDLIIVEPFIEGIEEYNLAGCFANEWIFSNLEKVEKNEFLDFEKKYLDLNKEIKFVHNNHLKSKFVDIFKKVYCNLFTNALIRIDFFYKDDKVYVNEVNPIPGSLAYYLFDDFNEVIEKLSNSIKLEEKILIDFKYLNQIQNAKGK